MWDNAPLLRKIANALFAFSILAVLWGSVYYVAHLPGLMRLQSVRLTAMPQRVSTDEVLAVVRGEVQGNLITVDIARLRMSLEKLMWVRSVNIRREFPDRLVLELEEHQALARWSDSELLNVQGELFPAHSAQELPNFNVQNGQPADAAQQYRQFNQKLEALQLSVTRMDVSTRNAWELQLNNGLVVALGRADIQQRLARFVEVYPYSIAKLQSGVKYVDLRYRNGFALGGAQKS